MYLWGWGWKRTSSLRTIQKEFEKGYYMYFYYDPLHIKENLS